MRFLLVFALILATACQQQPSSHSLVHESEPTLRVASGEPESIDPRLIRSANGVTSVHLMYEGVLRHDYLGRVVNGVAEKVEVSEDGKTWTINLKKALWSNGDPVTSYDFYETLLSTLTAGFPAPNAYQLYVIKGAKQYKEGLSSSENIGLSTPDAQTLIIELQEPVPFFKELLASSVFYPVHESMRKGNLPAGQFIGNGPFIVEEWAFNNRIKALKNPYYWDRDEVKLEEVELVFVDDNTALNMFTTEALDWVGSPNGNIPTDAIKTLDNKNLLKQQPAAATTWFRINTTRPVLNSKKFRQALYYSIDRRAIGDHLLHGKQIPATSIVPTFWLDPPVTVSESYNPGKAWELFQQALDELDTDRDALKPFTICYRSGERAQKVAQAIQQQWEKALGIKVLLEQCEGAAIFDKWIQMDYDIALGSWIADVEDPVNFLEVFVTKNTPTNNTGWENDQYKALIERSYLETGDTRKNTLAEAEKIIVDEAPVIPVFFHNYIYAKQPNVHGIWLSKLGFLDFKYAFIDDANTDELEPLD